MICEPFQYNKRPGKASFAILQSLHKHCDRGLIPRSLHTTYCVCSLRVNWIQKLFKVCKCEYVSLDVDDDDDELIHLDQEGPRLDSQF